MANAVCAVIYDAGILMYGNNAVSHWVIVVEGGRGLKPRGSSRRGELWIIQQTTTKQYKTQPPSRDGGKGAELGELTGCAGGAGRCRWWAQRRSDLRSAQPPRWR